MYILGLSITELVITIFVIFLLIVGMIGLKVRREQLLSGDPNKKQKKLEMRSENKRLAKEDDELAALMFAGESYDD